MGLLEQLKQFQDSNCKKKKKKVPSQKGSVQRKKKMAETVESIQSSFFERTE